MADSDLTQSEADALLAVEKHRTDDQSWYYPTAGGRLSIPLISADKREHFFLDGSKGRIDLTKTKYQNRARQVVVLARLEFGGPPHTNPDGEFIPCPHLHIYREDYGDKWAMRLPAGTFGHADDQWQTLHDFLQFCNVTEPPNITRGLFG